MEIDVSKYSEVPFKAKGRSLEGWDCWGLVYFIYKDLLNTELPLYIEDYQNTSDLEEIESLIKSNKPLWDKIEKPKPFDVVLLRIDNHEMHCGLFLGNKKFFHCRKGVSSVIGRVNDIKWRNRIVGYYRYRKRS